MPCLPMTGMQSGVFVLPQIGAGVWVEFERATSTIRSGSGLLEARSPRSRRSPAGAPRAAGIVLQTLGQTTLMLSDASGTDGRHPAQDPETGAMISINDAGITISNGKGATILMTNETVTVNAGALTVT